VCLTWSCFLQARKLRTEINKLASKAPLATYPMTFESPVWSNPIQPAAAPPPAIDTTYSMTFDLPVRAIPTKAASTRTATSQPVDPPKQEESSEDEAVVEEVRSPAYTAPASDDTQEWLATAHAALMGLVVRRHCGARNMLYIKA
jgi:hypothetical protein